MSEQRITISLSTLLWIVGMTLLLILLWQLRSLVITFMVAVILASALAPIVDGAERLRVPRWLGVILVYLSFVGGLTGGIFLIGPTVLDQIQGLITQLPIYLNHLVDLTENLIGKLSETQAALIRQSLDIQSLNAWAIRSGQQLVLRSYSVTRGILGGVFSVILTLLISGYMVADSQTLIKGLVRLFPQPWDERLSEQVEPVSQRMGGYLRGRILVSVILGVATTAGLSLVGLPQFAIGLGVIAGVTNLIPFVGPFLGAFPALLVALGQGGWTFGWVLLLFLILQNLETYVLDPLLAGAAAGVHPLYQLLAVLGGAQVLGIIGALVVPPWVAGIAALVENLYLKPKLSAERKAARTQTKLPSTSLSVP
ncbi:MAG: AI-2E family transporter [Leptolyngbyaceae bacterium]|nr:AI-2E family transporter [Leptolyngbyaceae bacterium]